MKDGLANLRREAATRLIPAPAKTHEWVFAHFKFLCEELVKSIIGDRREQGRPLKPDWIAAEAMKEIDPELVYSPVAHEGMRIDCRHRVRHSRD